VLDNSFVLCFNAHQEPIEFVLPLVEFGSGWRVVVYTGAREALLSQELAAAAKFTVDAHTAVVVQAVSKAQSNPGGLNTR
jgi:isoamylase